VSDEINPPKRMGSVAPKSTKEEIIMGFGDPTAKPPVDPNAETPPMRGLPPQGEPVTKASEATKGYYIYRGFRGVPFRSKSPAAPDIKAKDPKQPLITADARVRIFDLSKPGDLEDYQAVMDGIVKGIYERSSEERQWVPEKQTWFVFLRWGVRYWELPEEVS